MGFNVVNVFNVPNANFGEDLLEPLGATVVRRGLWHAEDEIIANAAEADALVCDATRQPFTRRVISSLSNCRILASVGVGYSGTDLEAARDCGIVVTNVPDYCIDEVSGRSVAFMLALGHKLFPLDRAVKERGICFVVDRKALNEVARPIFRMREQTVGIIGFGRIGMTTALKAKGLGMRVIAHDPYVFGAVMESLGVKPVDLDTLLTESDFVSIHSPVTSQTRGMFGYEQFKKMKPTAYFINVARGDIVDEAGLTQALREGLIAGAGLDVTAQEPIPDGNPLRSMPNVILTGHSAMYSESADPELWYKPMTQVVMALKGEWPLYAVNPDVKRNWLEKWGKKSR